MSTSKPKAMPKLTLDQQIAKLKDELRNAREAQASQELNLREQLRRAEQRVHDERNERTQRETVVRELHNIIVEALLGSTE